MTLQVCIPELILYKMVFEIFLPKEEATTSQSEKQVEDFITIKQFNKTQRLHSVRNC